MKICPVCQTHNPLEATFCPQCGHQFRTQFPQGGPAPTQMVQKPYAQPGMPQPYPSQPYGQPVYPGYPQQAPMMMLPPMRPTFFQSIFDPGSKARYQADLHAYMMATGQPAPYYGSVSDSRKFIIWGIVLVLGFFAWNSYHTRTQAMSEREQIEKQYRDMAAKYQKEIDQNPVNSGDGS